jgi:hypothetical protein
MKYILVDRETNNWVIDSFNSMEEAEKALLLEEKEDMENNEYKPDFYQIIQK